MGFRENLIKFRKEKYSSAKEFANKLGVSPAMYGAYESPSKPREPKYELLCKIAAALSVTTDELLGYSLDEYSYYKTMVKHSGLQINEYPVGTFGHDILEVCDPNVTKFNVLAGYISKEDFIITAKKAYDDYQKHSFPILFASFRATFINDFFSGYTNRRIKELKESNTSETPDKHNS